MKGTEHYFHVLLFLLLLSLLTNLGFFNLGKKRKKLQIRFPYRHLHNAGEKREKESHDTLSFIYGRFLKPQRKEKRVKQYQFVINFFSFNFSNIFKCSRLSSNQQIN